MKKEVVLAILIGLVLGLFITYGVYQARQNSDEQAVTDIQQIENQETPAPTGGELDRSGELVVYNPENETVQTERVTKIAGKAPANAFVVIYVNDTPLVTQADKTGNFSKEVELTDLSNVISVHSVDEDGETNQVKKTVLVHEDNLFEQVPAAETEATESDEDEGATDTETESAE
jgi:hypothetical protein